MSRNGDRAQQSPAMASDVNSRPPRRPADHPIIVSDVASDNVTAAFIRRVLCSHQLRATTDERGEPPPIEKLLPPLTSSNEVDLQLYAFISILIKEYVYTWYTRISPDHVFVSEVVQIIAHCTRSLEERTKTIDLEALIFDDLAELLDAHVHAFLVASRAAQAPEPSSNARIIYHTLRPHPALKPDIQEPWRHEKVPVQVQENMADYSAYRQMLAQSLLAVLLPTEDLQNPCLRALVSEVTADLIIGNFIGNRICQSVFVYDTICKASKVAQTRFKVKPWVHDKLRVQPNQLNRFGLLSTPPASANDDRTNFSVLVGKVLRLVPLFATAIRLVLQVIVSSAFLRPRGRRKASAISNLRDDDLRAQTETLLEHSSVHTAKRDDLNEFMPKPFLEYRIWPAMAALANFASRMPWASTFLSLAKHLLLFGPLELGGANGRLDRIIAHHVVSPLFPLSKHLPAVLLNLRLALFPGNALPPPASQVQTRGPPGSDTVSSSDNETVVLASSKRAAAFAILNLIPQPVARIYFAVPSGISFGLATPMSGEEAAANPTSEQRHLSSKDRDVEVMVKGVEDILDTFGDEYMNRHFAFAVMERVLVALVPELAEGKTIAELLADRGVGVVLPGDLATGQNMGGEIRVTV